MKYITIILILFAITFTSCDGRDRKLKNENESIGNNELPGSFFEQVSYIPEQYSEEKIDTIINNSFRISIKNYLDMNNSVLNEFKIDTVNYKHYYREVISDIEVELNNSIIFNKTIDKSFFTKNIDDYFWKNSLLLGIYIDQNETTNEYLVINASYCLPESEDCKDYNLVIDVNGDLEIRELKTEEPH